MLDVFLRSIDFSDPLISSICLKKRSAQNKKQVLPKDFISLLKVACFAFNNNNASNTDKDTDSESKPIFI